MLSPKRERKARSHRQPQHTDSTRLRQPMMQPDNIRGSAQNLMGMVQHQLLLFFIKLVVVDNFQLSDTESRCTAVFHFVLSFISLDLKLLAQVVGNDYVLRFQAAETYAIMFSKT